MRKNEIIRIIQNGNIETQTRLLEELRALGYNVTRATLSRDIKALGIGKQSGVYRLLAEKESLHAQSKNYRVKEVTPAGNIVALKLAPGLASAFAVTLDSIEPKKHIATIAGDDTIFVLCPNEAVAIEFAEDMKTYLE